MVSQELRYDWKQNQEPGVAAELDFSSSSFTALSFNKAQSNSAHNGIQHSTGCLVDIFCHIRQVAARVAKLVLERVWEPSFGEGEVVGSQGRYHLKEPVGCMQ